MLTPVSFQGMEANAEPASGDGLESLGPVDGGHGADYEFSELEKGSLGFIGVDKVKELKRAVKAAWEKLGQGHYALTPGARQGMTPALGCDPEVNHHDFTDETEDMEGDDSE